MFDEENEEPKVYCGVCGQEIREHGLCYEIRYGTLMNNKFQSQEHYMIVHSDCLKE